MGYGLCKSKAQKLEHQPNLFLGLNFEFFENVGCEPPKSIHIICPPTLEALVAMCYGEGALLHGQLVKFGELLECRRKRHKGNNEWEKKKICNWNFENISLLQLMMREKYEMGHEKVKYILVNVNYVCIFWMFFKGMRNRQWWLGK